MCFAECSILQIMGFGKQSRISLLTTDHKFGYNLMVFNKIERVDALLQQLIKRITSMWVYTYIIELSAVNDIQVPFIRYVSIQSKFDKMGYSNFNPLYYIKVKEHSVSNITIKIYTDTVINFPNVN